MPGADPADGARKKLARAGRWFLISAGFATLFAGLAYGPSVAEATGIILIDAFVVAVAILRRAGGRGMGSGLRGPGRDDDGGPAGVVAHRWHTLFLVSRLMPRSAGDRWLAEAESLLSETAADRRGAAIRSYLLSAPRLTVIMWAREGIRRTRLGPRRPG
jgi:hypothetical protein